MIKEDLPKEVLERMYSEIRKTKEWVELNHKRIKLQTEFRFAKAIQMAERLKKVEDRCVELWLSRWDGEVKKVSELTASMNEDDLERMNVYGNSLIFLSDIIETFSIEMNELLKKYHPTSRIEAFDKLNELAKEARNQVRMLDAYKEDTYYTNTYGTMVDKLNDMVYNKVKSFITKIKAHEKKADKEVA